MRFFILALSRITSSILCRFLSSELSVSLLPQLFRVVVLNRDFAIELLSLDILQLLSLDDVTQIALIPCLLELLKQMKLVLLQFLDSSVQARNCLEHLIVLLLVAVSFS